MAALGEAGPWAKPPMRRPKALASIESVIRSVAVRSITRFIRRQVLVVIRAVAFGLKPQAAATPCSFAPPGPPWQREGWVWLGRRSSTRWAVRLRRGSAAVSRAQALTTCAFPAPTSRPAPRGTGLRSSVGLKALASFVFLCRRACTVYRHAGFLTASLRPVRACVLAQHKTRVRRSPKFDFPAPKLHLVA